jgi:hypothetical protein
MGIIYSLLNNQEKYENNNDDYIIDIQQDNLHNTTDYRDYWHIHFKETLLHDNGISILNVV